MNAIKKFEYCKKCNAKFEMYKIKNIYISNLYSGNLCLKCYEKKFNEMSNIEKKPNFSNIYKTN